MGWRSNLGAWRAFLWRIIISDSSNPDVDNGYPMEIVNNDGNNDKYRDIKMAWFVHINYYFLLLLLGPMILSCVCRYWARQLLLPFFGHQVRLGTKKRNGKWRGRLASLVRLLLPFRDGGLIERLDSDGGAFLWDLNSSALGGRHTMVVSEAKRDIGANCEEVKRRKDKS